MAQMLPQEMYTSLMNFLQFSKQRLDSKVYAVELQYQIPTIADNIISVATNASTILYLFIENDLSTVSSIGIKVNNGTSLLYDKKKKTFNNLPKGYYTIILLEGEYVIENYSKDNNPILIGTAQDIDVLEGYTFYNISKDTLVMGTKTNNGTLEIIPSEEVQIVLNGYYEAITIKAYQFTDLVGTMRDEYMLAGNTYYSNSDEIRIGLLTTSSVDEIIFTDSETILGRAVYPVINITKPVYIGLEGDAISSDVRPGKTFYSTNAVMKSTGDMEEFPPASILGNITEDFIRTAGYSEEITIQSKPLPILSGNAIPSHVVFGKEFYNDDLEKQVGTMISQTSSIKSIHSVITNEIQVKLDEGFAEDVYITVLEPNFKSMYIDKTKSIFGLPGTFDNSFISQDITGIIDRSGTAATNLVAGTICFKSSTDSLIYKLNNNAELTGASDVGYAKENALVGENVSYVSLFRRS